MRSGAPPSQPACPVCLNRLAAASAADVLVLLESGALVGPRWLDLLLDALGRPGVGLAGPSTNRGWNEQAIFPRAAGSRAGVRRTAAEAIRRYGRAARTLAPLYSLAEFCYVVRREVLEAIGGADEGYGRAPCWEMDLNVRAARAGFAGLWVGGAYVYRSPPTARRAAEDEQLLDTGKRRYQDRLLRPAANGHAHGLPRALRRGCLPAFRPGHPHRASCLRRP